MGGQHFSTLHVNDAVELGGAWQRGCCSARGVLRASPVTTKERHKQQRSRSAEETRSDGSTSDSKHRVHVSGLSRGAEAEPLCAMLLQEGLCCSSLAQVTTASSGWRCSLETTRLKKEERAVHQGRREGACDACSVKDDDALREERGLFVGRESAVSE